MDALPMMDAMMTEAPATQKRTHRPRIMPVLLMQGDGLLYKTQKFRNPKYVGDPRIAVKIFNDKGADEIVLLDITAGAEKRRPNFKLIEEIASEAFMPMAYGGGIASFEDAKNIFSLGIEKVVLNSIAFEKPGLLTQIAEFSGIQSVVCSIDARKDIFGRWRAFALAGRQKTSVDPVAHARSMEAAGAGEILINAIDRDGTFQGYDAELCQMIAEAVSVPVIACGGAGKIRDCVSIIRETGVSAAAAGSIFVFQGPHRAVLIKFPTDRELKALFDEDGSKKGET
jgi:imidazole glycerol-phosphate synthase subunit HisF